VNVKHSNLGKRMAKGALWTVDALTLRSIRGKHDRAGPTLFRRDSIASASADWPVELASEPEFATYLIREQGIDWSYYDTHGPCRSCVVVDRRGQVCSSVAADFAELEVAERPSRASSPA
jgi:hypothetical protein